MTSETGAALQAGARRLDDDGRGERARAILEAAVDCVITIDHEGRVLEFNPAAERVFGYTQDEVVGRVLSDLIVPERLRAKHARGLAQYRATGLGPILGKSIELPALRADGTEILVELSVTRIDVPGLPVFTATLRDVGENRPAELTRRSQAFYRLVVESSGDLTALLDLEGRVVYASPAHEDKLGYAMDQLLGAGLLELVHPEDLELVRGAFVEACGGVRCLFPPVRLARMGGGWLTVEGALTGIVTTDGQVTVVLVKASDVAERVLEEAARERRERAERDFVANAAHELQTPLTAITAAVEVLQGGAKRDVDELDLFLGDIEIETARLRRLTRALLELSCLQAGEPAPAFAPVELRGLVADVASGLHLAEGVELRVYCGPDVYVLGDRDILELALGNIARNASASTTGGHVEFEIEPSEGMVEIVVRDSGCGMAPNECERALERFYRGSGNTQPGFGLGLALVSEATRILGGSVDVESELGVGTVVRLGLRAVG